MFARTLIISAMLGWGYNSATAADYYPEFMFIPDASGSMSEVAGGKTKIAVAKEVMHQIVPQLHENIRVGLTAYGHRRPGDCSDIEVLIPAGSTDRTALLQHVDQLQARGRTPISAAILSVSSMLKLKEAETTIILVSDGIETCGGDPCQVVVQLQKTGVKFVLHTVGFHVNAAAAQQLECVAGAGGGKYFAANDADQLLKALKAVSSDVLEKAQQVDPATVRNRIGISGLGKLRVTMPIGSEVSLAQLNISDVTADTIKRNVDKPKADGTYPLLSGQYSVMLGFATPSYGQPTTTKLGNVTIVKGETLEVKLGSISFNIPEKLENDLSINQVLITDAGTNEVIVTVRKNGNSYYHFKPKPIVAGVYKVCLNYTGKDEQPSVIARNVVVEPGKDTVVTLNPGIQLKEADDVIGWELIPTETAEISDKAEGEVATAIQPAVKLVWDGYGNDDHLWHPYLTIPGTYNLNVYLKGMKEPLPAGADIVIKAGELLQFDAGL